METIRIGGKYTVACCPLPVTRIGLRTGNGLLETGYGPRVRLRSDPVSADQVLSSYGEMLI